MEEGEIPGQISVETEPVRSRRGAMAALLAALCIFIFLSSWALIRQVPIAHFLDMALYIRTGDAIMKGAWPYIDFAYEYPLGAAIPMLPISIFSLQYQHFPDVAGVKYFVPIGDHTAPYNVWKQFFYGMVASAVLACVCMCWSAVIYHTTLRRAMPQRRAWDGFLRFVVFTALCVPILAFRFDYFPLFLTVIALWAAVRDKPAVSGLTLGLAVVVKLYPLVLVPMFIAWWATKKQWKRVTVLCVAGIVGMGAIHVPYLFKHAPLAPLKFLEYHRERGVQIESTWAGVAFLLRDLAGVDTIMTYDHGGNHVSSAVTPAMLKVQPVVMVVGYLATLWLFWAALRRKRSEENRNMLLLSGFLAVMLMTVLTSKIFSTQFVIWLLPGLAMLRGYRSLLAALALVLTFCVFPLDYVGFGMMYPLRALTLNTRNAILIYLLVVTMIQLARLAKSDDSHEPLGLRH